jgi:hypothetical protein
MESEKKVSAPYLPWATFITALDQIKAIGGVPHEINHSVFPSLNHQSRSQILSAFKFLGLIDEAGKPIGDTLGQLALQAEGRKAAMRSLIEKCYPDIVALDFQRITPSALDSALGNNQYNISGDTKKKAKTFLLKAAQFAGFSVSPLLTKITRNRRKSSGKQGAEATTKTAQADTNGSNGKDSAEIVIQPPPKARGSEKTVHLKSGAGSVTLLLDVDLMALEPGEEQDFVLKLRDLVRAYEKGLKADNDLPALPLEEVEAG